ncbi:unnamed protein product [Clonostachys byssicola]|uniref:Proline iminopeptidase n=1 Tax=Clonostachys byssicola TaxID=160290 RepID=A0A9N9Y5J5_9HYPO|nr:unnamed protein product [Clonostachys byssicola]
MSGYTHGSPFDEGMLPVGSLHRMYYAQYGRENGLPDGGPGGGTKPSMTKFFDPCIYRVVLFDQRGTGNSTPSCELRENTTDDLLNDIETLRTHLKIDVWYMAFGGSWGSSLALLYAQDHPDRVKCLVLRGIYTFRESEVSLDAGRLFFPDALERFINWLPEERRSNDPRHEYIKLMMSKDKKVALAAAIEWNRYDLTISTLILRPNAFARLKDPKWNMEHALIFAHYWMNKFWREDGHILKPENMAKIKHLPCTIVQGRYDVVCPPVTAWELHRKWPRSKFYMTDSGHSASEPETQRRLVEVCDSFARL